MGGPRDLRRSSRAKRRPRLALTIFCEGSNTEPQYLLALARAHSNPLVSVRIGPAKGVPLTLVQAARAEQRRQSQSRRDSFAARDEVWVVFDMDEHPNVAQAMQEAAQADLRVAFSNPCFEIWPLLHLIEHDAPIDRHALQRKLAGVMPGYNPKSGKIFDYTAMSDRFELAARRARVMRDRRTAEGDLQGNPYTDVDCLASIIIGNGKKMTAGER